MPTTVATGSGMEAACSFSRFSRRSLSCRFLRNSRRTSLSMPLAGPSDPPWAVRPRFLRADAARTSSKSSFEAWRKRSVERWPPPLVAVVLPEAGKEFVRCAAFDRLRARLPWPSAAMLILLSPIQANWSPEDKRCWIVVRIVSADGTKLPLRLKSRGRRPRFRSWRLRMFSSSFFSTTVWSLRRKRRAQREKAMLSCTAQRR
mmetsp:Transcript_3696/g.10817  ORF Transcript_3696/g.10817 Transcript_3696/m.10817 type:complete len:203 (-) Transcript_3696:1012-1620(-)